MSSALADVNVLMALVNPDHIHHEDAHQWLQNIDRAKWASCPLTANGCLRILSQATSRSSADVAPVLRSILAHPNHEFWPDSISILDESLFALKALQGAKQITDIYLLGLAVRRNGHLVTFDRSIPWRAVLGAKASDLKILGGPRTH